MSKPNCDCTKKITEMILEKQKEPGLCMIHFNDMNLFNGGLANYVTVETNKPGAKRIKKEQYPVVHNYCPFCGKKYLE